MTGSIFESRAGLRGRTAAILGGGGGIGAAVTLALAQAGVDVAFCDRDESATPETLRAVRELGVKALGEIADVTQPAALKAFYDKVGATFDRLDIVVNVAGGVSRGAFMDSTPESRNKDIQLNYGYVLESIQNAVPLIRRGGRGGSIINFTTIEAHRGAASFAVYAGAKAATTNFTRAIAVELGGERIRVNCIAPDSTPSAGNFSALPPEISAKFADMTPAMIRLLLDVYIPLRETPSVEDLANAVLFLSSDLARMVTGTTLHVDGGTIASLGFGDWPEGDGFFPAPFVGTLKKLAGAT